MQNPSLDLMEFIERNILPRYAAFDKAHQMKHVTHVVRASVKLANQLGADVDMAYAIAAYHDLGLEGPRAIHHITSGKILITDARLKKWFSAQKLKLMKEAVEDHRASGKNPPRTIYGAIVAEADRQIEPQTVIRRTMAYSVKLMPDGDFEALYQRSKEHLLEKYAEGGYLRLWLNNERNVQGLNQLRAIIKDENRLRALCREWYDNQYKQ